MFDGPALWLECLAFVVAPVSWTLIASLWWIDQKNFYEFLMRMRLETRNDKCNLLKLIIVMCSARGVAGLATQQSCALFCQYFSGILLLICVPINLDQSELFTTNSDCQSLLDNTMWFVVLQCTTHRLQMLNRYPNLFFQETSPKPNPSYSLFYLESTFFGHSIGTETSLMKPVQYSHGVL